MDENGRPGAARDDQRNYADMSAPRRPDDRRSRATPPRDGSGSDPNNGRATPSSGGRVDWDPTKKPGQAQRASSDRDDAERPRDDINGQGRRGGATARARDGRSGSGVDRDAGYADADALAPRKPVRAAVARTRPVYGSADERTWNSWDDDELGRPSQSDDLGLRDHESLGVADEW
ncbi:MAG TPA: hypothetical protein VJN88_07350, partial [Ktedonobacterales bacterium]|nr:hypothetical protein [Ktedonobacterales bacterium]